jgi:hypothetical protein
MECSHIHENIILESEVYPIDLQQAFRKVCQLKLKDEEP